MPTFPQTLRRWDDRHGLLDPAQGDLFWVLELYPIIHSTPRCSVLKCVTSPRSEIALRRASKGLSLTANTGGNWEAAGCTAGPAKAAQGHPNAAYGSSMPSQEWSQDTHLSTVFPHPPHTFPTWPAASLPFRSLLQMHWLLWVPPPLSSSQCP